MAIGVDQDRSGARYFSMAFGATQGRQIVIPDFRSLQRRSDALELDEKALSGDAVEHGITRSRRLASTNDGDAAGVQAGDIVIRQLRLTVNGKTVAASGRTPDAPGRSASRETTTDRHPFEVRAGRLRCLHRPHRRPAGAILHHLCRPFVKTLRSPPSRASRTIPSQ